MENQYDPQAVAMVRALKMQESGNNYNAPKETAGVSLGGAYQYQAPTWKLYAKQVLGNENAPFTPENQDKVTYGMVKKWKDQGLQPTDIAHNWNPGAPDYPAQVVAKLKAIVGKGSNMASATNNATVPPIQANQTPQQANPYGANAPATGNEGLGESISKGLQNVPTSAWNLAKSLGQVALHPIKTAQGLENIVAGGVEKLIPGQQGQEENFDSLISMVKDRYGSLENLKKTAINDPVGIAVDIASLFTGAGEAIKGVSLAGDANKIAELTAGMSRAEKAAFIADTSKAGALGKGAQIGQNISNVANAVNPINLAGKGVSLATKGLGKVASETLGVATGVGGKTIREGFNAALKGGEAYDAFKQGLKGNLAPEDLVNSAKSAVQEVIDNRGASYQEMLKGLKADTTIYNPTRIMETMRSQLQKFGIGETNAGLDFSRSKFALDKAAQNDITTLYEHINGWGSKEGDLSAIGIDNLKQTISGYYTPNSDYRAMTAALRDSARGVLENAPGYTTEMKNYADATEWITDTKKALSLGDRVMTETAFKKLTSAFRQNNEWRAQALQELDDITDGQLKASIAGQQMSSLMPRGLAKFGQGLEALSAMHAAVSGGAGVIPLLATMMVSSPRLVGEFVKTLGITGRGFDLIMSKLGGMVNPATIGATTRVQQLSTPNSVFGR